ncbi:MAG: hypothetical protein IT374_22925 [Polyangiaceae bacterium]|nr:hypothetical protein [Polyangiaceae bacterium]
MLGVVDWTDRDNKTGGPIAGVRPLVEIDDADWRKINPAEEFPSQGQIFWPSAQAATRGALFIFRAESNHGQKDEFKVVDPKPALEVLDLRGVGTPVDVRTALAAGVRAAGPIGSVRMLVWCQPDVLVGPVELTRVATGNVKLAGTNLARVPMFTGGQVRPVTIERHQRLLRVDDAGPSGYVDWDDDATVLRRALEAAVRIARNSGRDPGQTKRQIEDAAKALAAQGLGLDAQLDRYRLDRALALCANSEFVAKEAPTLAELLRDHPAMKVALDSLATTVRADAEQSARADLEQRLAREQSALKETVDALARTRSQLEATEREVRASEEKLSELQSRESSAAREVEAAVDERVLAVLERPLELLAEVSVLRPLLAPGPRPGRPSADPVPTRGAAPPIDWSSARGERVSDAAALRRILTSSARARGVDPSVMLKIHAATAAGLMPVALGPKALAALAAYARGACGDRLLIIHVSPSAIHVRDLLEAPEGSLAAASEAAKDVDGPSLVVLEGANRSPLEASLVPLLQMADLDLSPISSARGLRLAATLVAGATTVPVTSQLWSHAAAIYPEPISSSAATAPTQGDVSLSSDLLALGDVPTEAVEKLLEAWPECQDLRPVLERFGSALARLYDEERRVADALLHGLVLPFVATALSVDEQTDALGKAADTDEALGAALRRLRRRLC